MSERDGIFAGDDPFELARSWLEEAEAAEINDPNAIALSTVDAAGMPNTRMVLLKDIEDDAFVFYTNYGSAKAQEIEATGKASFVMHWKSLRRQIRVRGTVSREDGPQADAYYKSRSLKSRLGAWASHQSQPLASRTALMAEVAKVTATHVHPLSALRFGAVIAFTRLRLSFGRMGHFVCTIGSAGCVKAGMQNGK